MESTGSDDRIRVTFELRPEGRSAETLAREIAVEQTVEIPEDCFSPEIERRVVGRIESLESAGDGSHLAVLSYAPELVAGRLLQLVNLLYGNVSLMRGVRLVEVEWPAAVLTMFEGPRYGVSGLRELCAAPRRPLLAAAIKPVGLTVAELARDCGAFARGGADIVKDDHSLDEQATAPFAERVARCQEAVESANAATGGRAWYFPNLAGSPGDLGERVERLRGLGIRGVMVAPLLLGLDTARWLSRECGLAVLGHPTFSGAFFGATHGIAPPVLYGHLFRLAGCDGVIFVNAGGRFAWTQERCDAIAAALRRPMGGIRPAFPVPAGGVDVRRVPACLDAYGTDTLVLIGGSLYQQGDLAAATAALRRTLEEWTPKG